MERNVMGELNVYRGSGAKPNFSEIARRHGMDRHTVAKYWREGESAADGRSARGSAFDPLEEVIRAKAQLPGMTKMAVLDWQHLFGRFREGQPRFPELDRRHVAQRRVDPEVVVPVHVVRELGP